jgi:hypothetical protein
MTRRLIGGDPQPVGSSSPGRCPLTPKAHLGPLLPTEVEAEVSRFGRHVLERRLATAEEVPYWLMWVRSFLNRTTQAGPVEDAVRQFVREVARGGRAPRSGPADV